MNKIKYILVFLATLLPLQGFSAETFTLHTSAFTSQNPLSKNYTCNGKDISPELDWSAAPDKTKSFVLLLADSDAPSGIFYHWVLYNIPVEIKSVPENIMQSEEGLPAGILIGKNSYSKQGYNGPCPPLGKLHHYTFTLYALDTTLNLPQGADTKTVLDNMQHHILTSVSLTTTFRH